MRQGLIRQSAQFSFAAAQSLTGDQHASQGQHDAPVMRVLPSTLLPSSSFPSGTTIGGRG